MKIATMARGYLPAPHPTDMINAPSDIAVAVAEGLSKAGHDVTFFGPNGTQLDTAVETLNLAPLIRNMGDLATIAAEEAKTSHNILGLWDQYMAHEMFERASRGEYDLLHFHHPEAALPFARLYPTVPVVYTTHDPIAARFREATQMYGSPNQFYISTSDRQRVTAPDLPYLATVHNGIDPNFFTYSESAGDYLLFAGRIMPEKGVREAIQVAEETGSRLLIIGAVYANQKDYFATQVKPHLNDKILYLGFMERDSIVAYYQKAQALLAPIQWEEPFGLTMIEAMSCGTPVIATRRGAVPEIVRDGKTGFIVDTIAEMAAAVGKIDQIPRTHCRKHVEKNFSSARMVKDYAAAFEKAYAQFHAPATEPLAPVWTQV
ncbi:MAG: group 1 glycosyl transferase [Patescibacteria group bacterium]|nr:group 1 glycosyl transferase [Patescibacteria group bacterium]